MYTGQPMMRPNPHVSERYEFDFTCDGDWLYLNSFPHIADDDLQRQKALVADAGERWRVVDAWTGETVDQSSAVLPGSGLEAWLDLMIDECRRVRQRLVP